MEKQGGAAGASQSAVQSIVTASQGVITAAITTAQGVITAAITSAQNALAAILATLQGGTNPLTGTSQQTSGTGGLANFSSYSQLIASSAKASNLQSFQVCARNGNAAGDKVLVQVAVGGAGSEVVIGNALFLVSTSALDGHGFLTIVIERQFPAGTRFAYRSSCEGAAGATIGISWNVSQVA